MGVSAHWLPLINEVAAEVPVNNGGTAAMVERYAEIEQGINTIWKILGQHAYLNHLNALFGYQPLMFQDYLRF